MWKGQDKQTNVWHDMEIKLYRSRPMNHLQFGTKHNLDLEQSNVGKYLQ